MEQLANLRKGIDAARASGDAERLAELVGKLSSAVTNMARVSPTRLYYLYVQSVTPSTDRGITIHPEWYLGCAMKMSLLPSLCAT